jgi:hypothetical protein
MTIEIELGDVVKLRKKHPCGSDTWEVVRLGVDIGLVCRGCGRRVLLPRSTLNKRIKLVVSRAGDVSEEQGVD